MALVLKTQAGKNEPNWVTIETRDGIVIRITARKNKKNSTLTELVIESDREETRIIRDNAKNKSIPN